MHLDVSALVKRFDSFLAVDNVSFSLAEGEFLSLLGPSGCGKTTTLRMLAGFAWPDSGRIELAGANITDTPARRRNIGMVFQNYALFPHMSVFDNVAFGLKMRSVGRNDIGRRVARALEMVHMSAYGPSRPTELSGGQQQRVALARALVIEPELLLLDEPLSALDLKLREELREEISRITRELKITTVFVTHDQNEALVLSDRVAVMNAGRIEQIDSPEDLYRQPRTPFVARFLGGANVLVGTVAGISDGGMHVGIGADTILRLDTVIPGSAPGDTLSVAIRPEAIKPADENHPATIMVAIRQRRFLGSIVEFVVATAEGHLMTVRWPAPAGVSIGETVGLHIPPKAIVPLASTKDDSPQTTEAIT